MSEWVSERERESERECVCVCLSLSVATSTDPEDLKNLGIAVFLLLQPGIGQAGSLQ